MNYYNEFDPKAAAWLRELINLKLIPQGVKIVLNQKVDNAFCPEVCDKWDKEPKHEKANGNFPYNVRVHSFLCRVYELFLKRVILHRIHIFEVLKDSKHKIFLYLNQGFVFLLFLPCKLILALDFLCAILLLFLHSLLFCIRQSKAISDFVLELQKTTFHNFDRVLNYLSPCVIFSTCVESHTFGNNILRLKILLPIFCHNSNKSFLSFQYPNSCLI